MKRAWAFEAQEGQRLDLAVGGQEQAQVAHHQLGPGVVDQKAVQLLLVVAQAGPAHPGVIGGVVEGEVLEEHQPAPVDGVEEPALPGHVPVSSGASTSRPSMRSGVAVRSSRNFGRNHSSRRR